MTIFQGQSAILALILLPTLVLSAPLSDSIEKEIAAVETNLLPTTIIDGEDPFRLADRMAHYHVPGLSIAVIEDFELRWIRHYGVADVRTGAPVDDGTLFCVGSMSKGVTSAGVLTMVRDGMIDLDGDVDLQLAGWRIPANDFTAEHPVTPRLLMNHTGGAPFSPGRAYTNEGFPTVMDILLGRPPATTQPVVIDRVPGTEFNYSNSGFTILRLMVEERGGGSFDRVLAPRVFEPLGMTQSSFRNPPPPEVRDHLAAGHGRDGGVFADPPVFIGHVAAGGLWTTAADYAAFVIAIQEAAAGRSDSFLPKDLAQQMISPQASDRYGLGFFLHDRAGTQLYFSHIGDGAGFVGGFASHRGDGNAAVVLTNGLVAVNLCREVLKSVASVYDWPDFLPPERPNLSINDAELEAAAGRYRFGVDGFFELERTGEHLRVAGPGLPGYRLFRAADDTFVCRERDGELAFAIPPEGPVPSIRVNLADDIGRFNQPVREAVRMAPDERTPYEMLQSGDAEAAIAAYRRAHGKDPNQADVSEARLNRLGYRLMGSDRPITALAVFQLNADLYGSANCFDSLAEAQMVLGEFEASRANYLKSLELNPGNENARRMLAEMKDAR